MSRLIVLALLGLALTPALAVAQAQNCVQRPTGRNGIGAAQGRHHGSCDCAQCQPPACNCPQCKPPCKPTCKPPCNPPITPRDLPPPGEDIPSTPRGMYVAPPRTGVEVGESRAIGVNGMAIKFPAMRLQLPSIELPSISRMRQKAHMRIESATAPFVEDSSFGTGAGPSASRQFMAEDPGVATPRDATTNRDLSTPNCSKSRDLQLQAREAELEERMRKLDETESCLREQMKKLQDCLQGIESQRRDTDATPPSEDVPVPQPSTEGRRARPIPLPPVADRRDGMIRQSQYLIAETTRPGESLSLRRLPPVEYDESPVTRYPSTNLPAHFRH